MKLHRLMREFKAELDLRRLRGQSLTEGPPSPLYLPILRRLSRMDWTHAQQLLRQYELTNYVLTRTRNRSMLMLNETALHFEANNITGLITWLHTSINSPHHEIAYNRRGLSHAPEPHLMRIRALRSIRLHLRGIEAPTDHDSAPFTGREAKTTSAAQCAYLTTLRRSPHLAQQAAQWLRQHQQPPVLTLPPERGSALHHAFRRAAGAEQFNLAVHLAALGQGSGQAAAMTWLRCHHPDHHLTRTLSEPDDARHDLRVKRRVDHH